MPEKGLTSANWKRVLADKAETTGWALCVGAGISDPLFPAWSKLVDKIAAEDSEVVAVDTGGSLMRYFDPPLEPQERTMAQIEGWILGVA